MMRWRWKKREPGLPKIDWEGQRETMRRCVEWVEKVWLPRALGEVEVGTYIAAPTQWIPLNVLPDGSRLSELERLHVPSSGVVITKVDHETRTITTSFVEEES